jgi:glycosyltransferase involved in cell wall biosynthesis
VRILHVIDVVAPVGGAQTYIHEVAELLAASGHSVAVLHGDAYAGMPTWLSHENWHANNVGRWIDALDPQVVHVHGPDVPRPVAAMLDGVPVIHSLHDYSFACSSGTKYFRNGDICRRYHGPGCFATGLARGCLHRIDPRPFVAQYRRISRQLPALRGDALVVHSEYMRSVALANRFADESVYVVPLFVKTTDEAVPYPTSRNIVFAGRIVADKGLDVLIKALVASPESWDHLTVAGDGWDRERCEHLASSGGIAEKVTFLGHLRTDEVRQQLGNARVVVVPSRWPEPFGIVGLEAMAMGRPVIASDVGGIPEWLDDRETGILVPPGDVAALAAEVTALLADPSRAEEMGQQARERVERFSPTNHLQRLLSVYEGVVGRVRPTMAVAR